MVIKGASSPLIFAFPKGRILEELRPLLDRMQIQAEPDFYDENSRKLQFSVKNQDISIIRVRSFDVATFVAFGAAHIGVAGNDVLMEFDYPDIYSPLNLNIGKCRLSVAAESKAAKKADFNTEGHIRVATKYTNITKKYFAEKGVQAECIKLNGAVELAPKLGLCRRIVDLVSSGATLKANGLVEVDTIADVTSRLIVNRAAFKIRATEINQWIRDFEKATI